MSKSPGIHLTAPAKPRPGKPDIASGSEPARNAESPVPGDGGPRRVSDRDRRMRGDPGVAHNHEAPPSAYTFFPAVDDAATRRHRARTPPMAPRPRAPTATERPRTSSGPDSHKPSTADNRTSRDDLALEERTFERANYKSCHMPIRGSVPTPDASPKTQWQGRMATTARIATPESMDDKSSTGVIAIGMALGSPAHPPQGPAAPWKPPLMRAATAAPDVQASPGVAEETKGKGRKWGLFRSRSKRGKAGEPAAKRSMTDLAASPVVASPLPSAAALARTPGLQDGKGGKDKKAAKHKPIVVRSQTDPMMSGRMDMRAARGGYPQTATNQLYYNPANRQQNLGDPSAHAGQRLLDVEIPDVTMERYSVMFGNLLRPRPASLLARRQATSGKATLGKLKTINDDNTHNPELSRPRRITSPQPNNSPSFNLFPSTAGRSESPRMLSPHLRSNTSPALLPSPSKDTFPKPKSRKAPGAEAAATPPKLDRGEKSGSPAQRENTLPISKFHKQAPPPDIESPGAVFTESPRSAEQDAEVHIKDKLRPVFSEPAWEMLPAHAPASAAPSSSPGSSRKISPASSTSSEQTHETRPDDEERQAERALESAAEVSIARQISVSHQQRRMLGPFRAGRRRDGGEAAAGVKVPVGGNERLSETKSATPTIVHPEPVEGEPKAMHAHRKSSRVVLEGEP